MRICLMIEGQEGVSWEQWRSLATAAERAGLEGLFRSDHYRSILRGEPAGSLDAWTTLAALAACTTRLRLGTMVSPVTFRPASVLAKSVVTVDDVSGGRVELGIGAGWYEAEHDHVRLPVRHDPRTAGRARSPARRDPPPVGPRRRGLAEAGAAAAPADHRRRHRQAANGRCSGPLRRRVQHRLPVAGGGSRPPPRARGRRPRRRAGAARLLDDDRLRGRAGPRRRYASASAAGGRSPAR